MKILIYYQSSKRTVFLESLAQNFIQNGHIVHFLTTNDKGALHSQMKNMGVITNSHASGGNKIIQHINQWYFLLSYCNKQKIDVVFSHLQTVNLIAVLAQYFTKAKIFPTRHHANDVLLRKNKNALLIDRLINYFARKIIVVSNAVKDHIVTYENTDAAKIVVIPLGYNFQLYNTPSFSEVDNIKRSMQCKLLLVVIGRMNVNKKHIVALEAFNKLINENFDVKIILMDEGLEMDNLKLFVAENNLSERVLFTGYLENTINHLAACDLLIHPSVSEASNQVVKEAGFLGIPSIVCTGVGDFEEYIIDKKNGFFISAQSSVVEIYELIKLYYYKKEELKIVGESLKSVIEKKFDINNTASAYLKLINN